MTLSMFLARLSSFVTCTGFAYAYGNYNTQEYQFSQLQRVEFHIDKTNFTFVKLSLSHLYNLNSHEVAFEISI